MPSVVKPLSTAARTDEFILIAQHIQINSEGNWWSLNPEEFWILSCCVSKIETTARQLGDAVQRHIRYMPFYRPTHQSLIVR